MWDWSKTSPTETLYFFGGNNMTEWNSLLQHYESPPYVLPHTSRAYSFGIAGQRGVLFYPFSCISQFIFWLLVQGFHRKVFDPFVSRPWNWSPFSLAWSRICWGHLWQEGERWTGSLTFNTHTQSLASLKDLLLFTQRWFFYPPKQEPHFDRNHTTLSWVTEVYPNLPEDEAPLECTIRPGEVTTLLFLEVLM